MQRCSKGWQADLPICEEETIILDGAYEEDARYSLPRLDTGSNTSSGSQLYKASLKPNDDDVYSFTHNDCVLL